MRDTSVSRKRDKIYRAKSNKELFKHHVQYERKSVVAKNAEQKEYIKAILNHEIIICDGVAGVGKTHIAIGMAIHALDRGQIDRIVITRPAVEAGEKLGFLPGDLNSKLDPYVRPIFDELEYYCNKREIYQLRREGKIEICPLALMRGRTFANSYIIGDELQNATFKQIRMLLFRIGMNSKMILTGDTTQTDLPIRDTGGFLRVSEALEEIEGISVIRLSESAIVRNPIIGKILQKLPSDD